MTPTVVIDAPRTVTMKIGNRLWISSDDASMNREANPSAQMAGGSVRTARGLTRASYAHLRPVFAQRTLRHC
jgi:hypothetical protein